MASYEELRSKHANIVKKWGPKIALLTEKSFEVLEIGAGAAIAGVIQGRAMAHGKPGGARLFGLPADLAIGIGLELAGHFDLAGEHSHHLNNFGAGFIAGFASDWGVAFGRNWVEGGHFPSLFHHNAPPQLPPPGPPMVKGEIHPQQMADALVNRMAASE